MIFIKPNRLVNLCRRRRRTQSEILLGIVCDVSERVRIRSKKVLLLMMHKIVVRHILRRME